MPVESFTQLDVYRDAEMLGDSVWRIVSQWDHFAKRTIGEQLVRSADSVGANIAEGWGRESWKDRLRHCHIARGSLMETRHWLRRAVRRGLLAAPQLDELGELVDRLGRRLSAYITHLQRRSREAGGGQVRETAPVYGSFWEEDLAMAAASDTPLSESTNQRINPSLTETL